MNGAVQMGPNAVSNPGQLMQALQGQQPPTNPQTPAERLNPDQQVLEHIKSAQVSIDRARAYTNDEMMLQVFDIIAGTLSKALLKFDGGEVLQSLQGAAQSIPPMGAAAPGGMPPGPPMGGPPQAGPPMGGPPMQAGAPPQGVPLQ